MVSIFSDSYYIKNVNSSDNKTIESIRLCNTLKNLYSEKKPNSVLWIPQNNIYHRNAFDLNYEFAKPFTYSALSEMPLIFGFPEADDSVLKSSAFGFSSYDKYHKNLTLDLNLSSQKLKIKGTIISIF